jgi:hypothetical protein
VIYTDLIIQNFVMRVYPNILALPSFIFYDSNCSFLKMLEAEKALHDPFGYYFDNCGLPVDVFHFWCKHKWTDTICNEKCNALNWPQLTSEDGSRRYNSSRAEQTNAWIGRYQSMLREMPQVHYRFVLDKMVKRRNRYTLRQLEEKGLYPYMILRNALGIAPEDDFTVCNPGKCTVPLCTKKTC